MKFTRSILSFAAVGALAFAFVMTLGNVNVNAQDNGTTVLNAETCSTGTYVEAYDIDFGTFLQSEVAGTTHVNAGTKTGDNERTSTEGSATTDFFAFVANPCAQTGWNIDVTASQMTGATYGNSIAASALDADGDGTLYRFNDYPANAAVSVSDPNGATLDSSLDVLDHDGTDNGIGGEYGALLTHNITIPIDTIADTYNGTYTVTCGGC